jgi:hypothetical protein
MKAILEQGGRDEAAGRGNDRTTVGARGLWGEVDPTPVLDLRADAERLGPHGVRREFQEDRSAKGLELGHGRSSGRRDDPHVSDEAMGESESVVGSLGQRGTCRSLSGGSLEGSGEGDPRQYDGAG